MAQLHELNLRDYWNIFLKRRGIVVISFLSVFLVIGAYISAQMPMYMASLLLKVDPYLGLPSEIVFPNSFYGVWPETNLSDYAKQIVSIPVIEAAAKNLGIIKENTPQDQKNSIIANIADSVSATVLENSNIIKLNVQSNDPYQAASLANSIALEFKKINIEQKNQRTRNVKIFISKTLEDVSKKLKEQDERLRVLTMRGAVGIGVNLVNQIYSLEQKRTELLTKFTEKHPDVTRITEQLKDLKAQLRSLPQEEFEYGILKRDIAITETLYTALKQKLPEAEIKEAEKVDNIFIVNPALPPKEPFSPNKKRGYTVGIVLGLVFSVTMAMLVEHLDTSIGRIDDIEAFLRTNVLGVIPFCSPKDTETSKKKRWWREPLVKGVYHKKKRGYGTSVSILEQKFASIFLEAFRILSVNIQVMFGKGEKIRETILLVTSCNPEEGKTLVVSNLGIIFAQMGYKTLIIDADTRRASIHKVFGLLHKEDGLLDVLTGKLTFDKAVKTVTDIILGTAGAEKIIDKPWMNNINILTVGSVFPNPITLFNSEKMNELLNYARSRYDIVLIDTSPILAVSEPSIIIPKTDGVLLVYKAGVASRLALRRAKIQIESVKGKGSLSGVILNNVTPEIGMDTYYYYQRKYYGREHERFHYGKKQV
ncbi:MAG: AAA family ATPase [Candidatus Omnitrophica bacterium]|nr:AAA family ATPase [Candidatus Omnitrophota bacterium]